MPRRPAPPSDPALPRKGFRTHGSRATTVVPLPPEVLQFTAFSYRVAMRLMTLEEFVNTGRSSGTLRKNRSIGMNSSSHLLHERVAYEFGYPFEAYPERFVTWGEARSEPDCPALTEAGWHVERYASIALFPGDEMECKYITVEVGGVKREGVGIVIRKTSVAWLPAGYIVFALIATYDPQTHDFLPAVNPC